MNMIFIEKDQNWEDGETTYWYELTGTDKGTGIEFDHETIGVVESENNEPRFLNSEGYPMTLGDFKTTAAANSITVSDEHRAQ